MLRDDALILDIVLAAEDIREFVGNMDFASFETSRLHQNAVIRSLEVIGEATGKLSAEFKSANSDLPWRSISNMRNRLIHAYNDISLHIVWSTVEHDVPKLIEKLKPLVPAENT